MVMHENFTVVVMHHATDATHAIPTDSRSERYSEITQSGVELAKARIKPLIELVNKSAQNAVVFVAGTSDALVAQSSVDLYGDILKDELGKGQRNVVITFRDLKVLFPTLEPIRTVQDLFQNGYKYKDVIQRLSEIVKQYSDKRVIIGFPLFMKELSMQKIGWVDSEGNFNKIANYLESKSPNNWYEQMVYWLENEHDGITDGIPGPKPIDIANGYITAVNRLNQFAHKHILGSNQRPLVIGLVAHNWDIDLYLTKMATGKVDVSSFKKVAQGSVIGDSECALVQIEPDNTAVFYRGRSFSPQTGT